MIKKNLLLILICLFVAGCSNTAISVSENKLCDSLDPTQCATVNNDGTLNIRQITKEDLPFVAFFFQITSPNFGVVSDMIKDNNTLVFSPGHPINVGERVAISTGDRIYRGTALSVVGDTVVFDMPFNQNDSAANLSAFTINQNLAVDGSVTPQTFIMTSAGEANLTLDITRMLFHLLDTQSMDDSTFGGCPALEKGIVVRFVNGLTYNIFNAKKNADFVKVAYDTSYREKTGGGKHSMSTRLTFSGTDKFDTVIRVRPDDSFQIIVQDDLTCLDEFQVTAEGTFTSN